MSFIWKGVKGRRYNYLKGGRRVYDKKRIDIGVGRGGERINDLE
jgi:hypothetical protein